MKKGFGLVLVFALLMSLSFGCGLFKQEEKKPQLNKPKKEEQPKVGIAMASTKEDQYTFIKEEMDRLKKEEKVELIWKDAEMDPLKQSSQIDELLEEDVKAIVLHPVSVKESKELVKRAMEKGVKVIALEGLPEDIVLDGYIAPDFRRSGELQGQFMAKEVPKGEVLVLTGPKEEYSSKALYQGLEEGIAINPDITLVREEFEKKEAKELESEILGKLAEYPDVKGIIAQGEPQTMALLEFRKNSDQELVTVGYGGSKQAVIALDLDMHQAEVDNRPDLLAHYAIQSAKELANDRHLEFDQRVKNDSGDVPVKIIPVRLVKKENIFFLEERWGKELKKEKGKEEEKNKEGEKKQEEGSGGSGEGKEEGQNSGNSPEGNSPGGNSPAPGSKTKVIVKTKDGKIMEMEIDGEIAEIKTEVEQGKKEEGQGEEGKKQEEQGGGQ